MDELLRHVAGLRFVGGLYVAAPDAIGLRALMVGVSPSDAESAGLATSLREALAAEEHGFGIVTHDPSSPEMTAWRREEEMVHRMQAMMDEEDPGRAILPQAAAAIRARFADSDLLKVYAPMLRGPNADAVAAAEVAVRLLLGDASRVGIGEDELDAAAAEYLHAAAERWGHEHISNAIAGTSRDLSGQLRSRLAELQGRRGEDLQLPPGAPGGGRERGPGFASLAGPGHAIEPERGPFARAFQFFDRALEPAAQAAGKVEAGLSKYHGVSTPARQALRGYEERPLFWAH